MLCSMVRSIGVCAGSSRVLVGVFGGIPRTPYWLEAKPKVLERFSFNMAQFAETFVVALEADLISADDSVRHLD